MSGREEAETEAYLNQERLWIDTSDDKNSSGYYVYPGSSEYNQQKHITPGSSEYMGSDPISSAFDAAYSHLKVGRVRADTEATQYDLNEANNLVRTGGGGTSFYVDGEKVDSGSDKTGRPDTLTPALEEWERYVGITKTYDAALTKNRQQSIRARLLGVSDDYQEGTNGNARSNTAIREVRVA